MTLTNRTKMRRQDLGQCSIPNEWTDGNGPERHPQCGTAVLSSAIADGEVLRMGPM